MDIVIKDAVKQDVPFIYEMLSRLADEEMFGAESEVLGDLFTLTEEKLEKKLFQEKSIFAAIAFADEIPVGIATYYFYNASEHSGKEVLCLEDIFIIEEFRQFKIGRQMLTYLKKIAEERNCILI